MVDRWEGGEPGGSRDTGAAGLNGRAGQHTGGLDAAEYHARLSGCAWNAGQLAGDAGAAAETPGDAPRAAAETGTAARRAGTGWQPASLAAGQLERIRRLEQELGVVLVAYERNP